jgi:hypothetical protein
MTVRGGVVDAVDAVAIGESTDVGTRAKVKKVVRLVTSTHRSVVVSVRTFGSLLYSSSYC